MKLMLAGLETGQIEHIEELLDKCKYVLSSYYYLRQTKNKKAIKVFKERNEQDNFILDSGAFTLMTSKKNININQELEQYTKDYIAFIKENKVKRYIELDLDSVIGYEKVIKLRQRLENEIGWKSMPVWHMSRGIDEFKKHCEEYSYIAIGGLVEHVPKSAYPLIKELVRYANYKGVKVHGLGFTNADSYNYGFYSVDSSSWSAGRRYGQAVFFNGNKIQQHKKSENTKGVYRNIDRNNFIEWCKFQRYVERF